MPWGRAAKEKSSFRRCRYEHWLLLRECCETWQRKELNVTGRGFSFSQHNDVTIPSLCSTGWDKVPAVLKDSSHDQPPSLLHRTHWLLTFTGLSHEENSGALSHLHSKSRILQPKTQQRRVFLTKGDTSCTEREKAFSYQNSWCSMEEQIDSWVQKPPEICFSNEVLPKTAQFEKCFKWTCKPKAVHCHLSDMHNHSEPSKLMYQTHVTWHRAEHLVKQCQSRTPAVPISPQAHMPSSFSSILLITSIAFLTYLVLNCTFLQCILFLHPCVYLQSALRMIYTKTQELTQWDLLHGKVQSHKTFTA